MARSRPDRLFQADLTDALGHRHQHRVDHRQPADDQRQQGRAGGDAGQHDGGRLERLDEGAGRGRLDSGHLVVDPVGELVEVDARLGVDVDAGRQLRRVDVSLERGRQGVAEQGLPIFEAHDGEVVGRGQRLVQDADDGELVAHEVGVELLGRLRQLHAVAHLFLELLGDV